MQIDKPTVTDFTNATHDHSSTSQGGTLSGYLSATRGNWKVFYSNGSGVFTELALGASGTVLQSNGASSAPSFVTPSSAITGEMKMWPTASAPTGYLICDGSAVSRTTYSALHAILKDVGGTNAYAWGNGNGSTTFNLPDMRGAAPAGVGTSTGYTSNETVALGTKYDDQFQGHRHYLTGSTNDTVFGQQVPAYGGNGAVSYTLIDILDPNTDGTNGTPRTGAVTKGKTVGVNFIIKT